MQHLALNSLVLSVTAGSIEWQRRRRNQFSYMAGTAGRSAPGNPVTDLERAQDVARRYRCEFVDLTEFQLHHELFKKIPVELMFRYNFVPLEETADGKLAIAIADPSQLMMIDEISLLLQAHRHQSFDAQADHRHPQEDRAVAARARRGQRRLHSIIREDDNTGAKKRSRSTG